MDNNCFKIRYSNTNDTNDIYSLMKDVFKSSPLFLRDSKEDFDGYQGIVATHTNTCTHTDTCTYKEKIVGALLFTIVNDFCYIEYIGTVIQHCGIGTLMLNKFLTLIDEKKLTGYLHVEITDKTNDLIKWYSKHGFKCCINDRENWNIYPYFGEQVNAITMTRNLD